MSFLLDTNAISEPGRKSPDPGFMAWWRDVPADQMFVSVLSLGEIRRGVNAVPDADRRRSLERFLSLVRIRFGDRLLSVDERVAESWGVLAEGLRAGGHVSGAIDELIAATALAHGLTVVTRHTRHFEPMGCKLLSPWGA